MHINGIGYLLLFKYAYTLQYLDKAVIVLIVYFGKAYYVKKNDIHRNGIMKYSTLPL